jgi:hypothetical protein
VLYLWVAGQELDSIEARVLTADNLLGQTRQHITLTLYSTFFVLLLAVPLGILATRPRLRRYAPMIIGLGNAGQAIPSLGLLALLFYLFRTQAALPSTGTFPVVVALVGYSFLPILRNTMVGLDQVDRFVLEAGRGHGHVEPAGCCGASNCRWRCRWSWLVCAQRSCSTSAPRRWPSSSAAGVSVRPSSPDSNCGGPPYWSREPSWSPSWPCWWTTSPA